MLKQPVHQRDVAAGTDRQVQGRFLGGLGAARVDDDQLRACLAARADALIDDRMAPGGVRPDEDEQVGGVEIVIGRWDDILAERAHMARDRARHAESRIGVDRSEEHTSELQSLMRNSYAVFCVKKKKRQKKQGQKADKKTPRKIKQKKQETQPNKSQEQ